VSAPDDAARLHALAFTSDALSLNPAAPIADECADCLNDARTAAAHAVWLPGLPLSYSGCFVRFNGASGPRFHGGHSLTRDIEAARAHFEAATDQEAVAVCHCVARWADELAGFVTDFFIATAAPEDNDNV
jgi:hypothetical protein